MTEEFIQIPAGLILSPEGHVYFKTGITACEELPITVFNRIEALFAKGNSYGLLHLGIEEFPGYLPISFRFWQKFARRFIAQVCKLTQGNDVAELLHVTLPEAEELQEFIEQALFIQGFEYLIPEVLCALWIDLAKTLKEELKKFVGHVQAYLQVYNPRWNLVGRVCFHLAEKKNDENYPFAFLATYTSQLSQVATPQHLPLKRALQDYSGESHRQELLALLLPMQKAAEQSTYIRELVDTGRIFQPLALTAIEAHRFLKDIPLIETSGVIVRVPNWWNSKMPVRPRVQATIGQRQKGGVGLNALLDFEVRLTLGDEQELSPEEWEHLLSSKSNFIKIKEQWVEIDRDKLQAVLEHWNKLQINSKDGISMAEGLRLLAGVGSGLQKNTDDNFEEEKIEWSMVKAGDSLKALLDQLRNPANAHNRNNEMHSILNNKLQATLRPYQQIGVNWLWQLYELKLGGCLADDMGLGKTIQVLALLLLAKEQKSILGVASKPHLLIVPASLLGNWQNEALRFAPSLKMLIAHSSAGVKINFANIDSVTLSNFDLVITTYAFVQRLPRFKEIDWDLIILDEAQQIKNPNSKQTKAVKALTSEVRLILTGTPVENKLIDLWSLFDFTSTGLLGSSKAFTNFSKQQVGKQNSSDKHSRFIAALRSLTQPYILRRLKSDKKIISDLPDKTEMQTYCTLSKTQAQYYQQAVTELEQQLQIKDKDPMTRRGLVLSYIMRLKQICNHPTQWLGYGDYSSEMSGKFLRLREICEEIAAKQEKVLVFTQFREIIPILASLLTEVFGSEGLTLDGDTPVKKRTELVDRFQQEQGPSFFVLSLKAGGTGLTLTRASHVIHFDRWWNPAVENQATDRAYRIGQKHPVIVHKFICRGTIEDKIDLLIASKKSLSDGILGAAESELNITELSNDELIKMLSLDIEQALTEL